MGAVTECALYRIAEHKFAQRAKRLQTTYLFNAPESGTSTSDTYSKLPADTAGTPKRAPFLLSHELSRGALAGLQSTLHYVLMLVVMTFNAAFIVSAILGVVVGEVAFGRLH